MVAIVVALGAPATMSTTLAYEVCTLEKMRYYNAIVHSRLYHAYEFLFLLSFLFFPNFVSTTYILLSPVSLLACPDFTTLDPRASA